MNVEKPAVVHDNLYSRLLLDWDSEGRSVCPLIRRLSKFPWVRYWTQNYDVSSQTGCVCMVEMCCLNVCVSGWMWFSRFFMQVRPSEGCVRVTRICKNVLWDLWGHKDDLLNTWVFSKENTSVQTPTGVIPEPEDSYPNQRIVHPWTFVSYVLRWIILSLYRLYCIITSFHMLTS